MGQAMLSAISAAVIPQLFKEITDWEILSGPARSRYIKGPMRRFLRIELKASDIIKSDIARVRTLAFSKREERDDKAHSDVEDRTSFYRLHQLQYVDSLAVFH